MSQTRTSDDACALPWTRWHQNRALSPIAVMSPRREGRRANVAAAFPLRTWSGNVPHTTAVEGLRAGCYMPRSATDSRALAAAPAI